MNVMSSEKDIKDAMKKGKLVTGKNSVTKGIKNGNVTKVYVPTNCPAEFLKELEYYGKISKVEIEKFKGTSEALGQICGKPFRIVMLGIGK